MTAPADLSAALAGRYDLKRELGRGGMATVYLADDRRYARPVAVKVLHPDLAATLGAGRFLREIRIAARLSHPHLLPLLDSGEAAGFLYYVTPFVADGSLRGRLEREGRLPFDEVVRILREVGSALDYAHREGVLHRDVKPENVLFAGGHAVLADFGIARAISTARAGAAAEQMTEVGVVLGTPEYMSPEQAAGESSLTGASDAWSLACVAYELLAGEAPLRGKGARETMARHVIETPRPVRALRPEVPVHAERALARALARDPRDRYASIAEFVAALEQPPATAEAAPSGRSIAVLPFVNASSEPDTEYLSDGITDELMMALARVEGLRVAARGSVFAFKGRPSDVRAVGAQLDAAWVLEGAVRRSGNRLRVTAQLSSADDGRLHWSETFDRTMGDVFTIQEEIARTIVATLRTDSRMPFGEPPRARRGTSVSAYGHYLRGRYAWNLRTEAGVIEAIRCFEAAIREDPSYALAYAGLADSYALGIDYRNVSVEEGFARAKEYARKALELDESVAEAHASLAWAAFVHDWDWDTSRREFRRALELDPSYATAHQWYAFWLAAHGQLDEAVAEVRRAAELDAGSVSIRRTVGWAYYYARRYDEARSHLERAVAMNPNADETYRVLGLTHAMAGEWAEAEETLREAIALSGGGWYDRATLGYVLARTGRESAARDELAALEQAAREGYISPVAFATVYLGLGDRDRALDHMERALEHRRGWMAYLRVNPIVDPLRGLARFEALMRAMRL